MKYWPRGKTSLLAGLIFAGLAIAAGTYALEKNLTFSSALFLFFSSLGLFVGALFLAQAMGYFSLMKKKSKFFAALGGILSLLLTLVAAAAVAFGLTSIYLQLWTTESSTFYFFLISVPLWLVMAFPLFLLAFDLAFSNLRGRPYSFMYSEPVRKFLGARLSQLSPGEAQPRPEEERAYIEEASVGTLQPGRLFWILGGSGILTVGAFPFLLGYYKSFDFLTDPYFFLPWGSVFLASILFLLVNYYRVSYNGRGVAYTTLEEKRKCLWKKVEALQIRCLKPNSSRKKARWQVVVFPQDSPPLVLPSRSYEEEKLFYRYLLEKTGLSPQNFLLHQEVEETLEEEGRFGDWLMAYREKENGKDLEEKVSSSLNRSPHWLQRAFGQLPATMAAIAFFLAVTAGGIYGGVNYYSEKVEDFEKKIAQREAQKKARQAREEALRQRTLKVVKILAGENPEEWEKGISHLENREVDVDLIFQQIEENRRPKAASLAYWLAKSFRLKGKEDVEIFISREEKRSLDMVIEQAKKGSPLRRKWAYRALAPVRHLKSVQEALEEGIKDKDGETASMAQSIWDRIESGRKSAQKKLGQYYQQGREKALGEMADLYSQYFPEISREKILELLKEYYREGKEKSWDSFREYLENWQKKN